MLKLFKPRIGKLFVNLIFNHARVYGYINATLIKNIHFFLFKTFMFSVNFVSKFVTTGYNNTMRFKL